MTIALMITDRDLSKMLVGLQTMLPGVEIKCWPEIESDSSIEFAVAWQHPKNMWQLLPNLKVVSSLGAGVDKLVNDPKRPNYVQITRVVDKGLSSQMAEYVLTCMLMHKRRMQDYSLAQRQKQWLYKPRLTGNKVTILGAGEIGLAVAKHLQLNGFVVSTWSQSPKNNAYIEKSYVGDNELLASVEGADYVVSILPATKKTDDLVNQALFEHMPKITYFINVGRGNAVDEHALCQALQTNSIAGATLDVFKNEPLPEQHPFWQCKNLHMTPHISAITDDNAIIEQIAENYCRFTSKKTLKHLVNVKNGY